MPRTKPNVPKIIPLSGKLILSEDPLSIGENFQSLKNLRYTADHVKGVGGMTKINTTVPATYNKIRTAHHFKKDQPVESHVLAQAFDTAGTASRIIDNKSIIPATGDFEAATVFTEAANSVTGHFSDAPSGNVAYCNGIVSAIWGGNERRIARFINYDPGGSFSREMTEQVTNTLTDADNVAILSRVPGITTWESTIDFETNTEWDEIAWSPQLEIFVAFGGTGSKRVGYSSDGRTWVKALISTPNLFEALTWADGLGLFVAIASGAGSPGSSVATSPDGIVWSRHAASAAAFWNSVAWSQELGLLAAVNSSTTGNRVMTSPDGVTWTNQITPADNNWQAVAWSPELGLFVAVASSGIGNRVMTSSSGTSWSIGVSAADSAWASVEWSPELSLFVAVASTAVAADSIMVSSDGINWVKKTAPSTNLWTDVIWSPELSTFVAVSLDGAPNQIMTSSDGLSWAQQASQTGSWLTVSWASSLGLFVALEGGGGGTSAMRNVADAAMYFLVGSTRTLQGFKIQISTANTIAGTGVVEYWDGSAWVAVSGLSDGTVSAGKPLAQSGVVSFTSTESVAKIRSIDSVVLYWYRYSVSAGVSPTTALSYITLDSPFQIAKDIWDGILREELSFQVFLSGNKDNTVNVFKDTYDSLNTGTFANIGALQPVSGSLFAGFADRTSGILVSFVSPKANSNVATIKVSYWDGTKWVSLVVTDGTKLGSTSFGQSGVITWNPPLISSEFKREVNESVPLYFYKIEFDKPLSATVDIFFVAGIPAQKTIKGFSFPMLADNRLWLLDEASDERNACIVTAQSAPDVYNGTDTERFKFGGEEKLTAGAWIYQNIGAEVRSIKIITKQNETWIIEGTTPQNWIKYQLSDKIGCVAPATMKTFTLGDDQSQQVAIFQGSRGIYLCDGRSIVPIHNDIRQLFDDRQGASINLARAKDSVGVFDEEKREYHWFFADGSNTALNRELVYDVLRKRWFEIDRGIGNRLQYATSVADTDGNNFLYGTIDLGFLLRLEDGNNFIGTDIAHEFQLGDMVFVDLMHLSQIEKIKLIGVAKQVSTPAIGVTHFGDSNTTGSILSSLSVDHAGHRLFGTILSQRLGDYYAHSLKFTQSTGLESIGFEPIAIGIYYKDINEHLLNIDSQPLTGGLFGTGNFGE